MNYLGHAFLSFGDKDILTGNMIGDHVKGRLAMDAYPAGIKKGIELHRKIDAKVDMHPATARAKILFRQDYGLYSGPIMDTLFDHYLANDPKQFANETTLLAFTQKSYEQLAENAAYFPAGFVQYFQHMKEYNWLYGCRTMKGMERSLGGLVRRAQHMPPMEKAYETFVTNYYHLNQCYFELIDDVISYVKTEIIN